MSLSLKPKPNDLGGKKEHGSLLVESTAFNENSSLKNSQNNRSDWIQLVLVMLILSGGLIAFSINAIDEPGTLRKFATEQYLSNGVLLDSQGQPLSGQTFSGIPFLESQIQKSQATSRFYYWGLLSGSLIVGGALIYCIILLIIGNLYPKSPLRFGRVALPILNVQSSLLVSLVGVLYAIMAGHAFTTIEQQFFWNPFNFSMAISVLFFFYLTICLIAIFAQKLNERDTRKITDPENVSLKKSETISLLSEKADETLDMMRAEELEKMMFNLQAKAESVTNKIEAEVMFALALAIGVFGNILADYIIKGTNGNSTIDQFVFWFSLVCFFGIIISFILHINGLHNDRATLYKGRNKLLAKTALKKAKEAMNNKTDQ